MARVFDSAGVIGVGLIGGSLALAARRNGLLGEVIGVGRTEANLEVARRRGIVDRTTRDLAELAVCDLIVLAVPVPTVGRMVEALRPHLRAGTCLTDVASVKAPVVEAVEAVLPPEVTFVGAHPIAGTEESGAQAADSDLFRGARCVLTPSARSTPPAVARVRELWEGVGARVVEMDAPQHDRILAHTSHLVHAIAYSLAASIDAGVPDAFDLAGPSLRDATRVAATRPELWEEIFAVNAVAIDEAMRRFGATFERLRLAVEKGDEAACREILEAGHLARKRLERIRQ